MREEEALLGQSRLNYFLKVTADAVKMVEVDENLLSPENDTKEAKEDPLIKPLDTGLKDYEKEFPCFDFQMRGVLEYAC